MVWIQTIPYLLTRAQFQHCADNQDAGFAFDLLSLHITQITPRSNIFIGLVWHRLQLSLFKVAIRGPTCLPKYFLSGPGLQPHFS